MELKKTTRLAMLLSISIVLSVIEGFIPIFNGMIPGVKLGLANIIILTTLYIYGFNDAIYLSLIRVVLIGILRTGLFGITFWFSFFGAILSIIGMFLASKTKLSIIGVSIIGSIMHSIGQIIAAIIFINNFNMVYYLPWIIMLSIPTGIIVGIISKQCVKFLNDVC